MVLDIQMWIKEFEDNPHLYVLKPMKYVGIEVWKLKKNSVALDIVNFGEEDKGKAEKLEALLAAVNNNDSKLPATTKSSIVVVRGGRRENISIYDVVGDVIPLKIGDQMWLAWKNKVKTVVFLQRIGVLNGNASTLCGLSKNEEESSLHVLQHCPFVWRVCLPF
ncbi:unnamed protein product [Camellia sinensis]